MSSLTQFARSCAAERAAVVNQQRELVHKDPTGDGVHDFRVALRRMEQIFELFDTEPLSFDTAQAQQQMKTWMRAAGRVRDCDVVMPLLQAPWTNELHRFRQERAGQLLEVLQGPAMPAPHARQKASITAEVAQFARITLPHEAKAYFHAGARAARKNHSLGRLHEFRLHGKSLRYSVELFEPAYGPRIGGLQKMLKRTQQLLGEMADARAAIKILKQMNAHEEVMTPLRDLAREKRDAFAVRWVEEIPDETIAAKWVEYLRRYAKESATGRLLRSR